MGIIYLIQPEEFLNSDVLKLGRSVHNTLKRPYKGYRRKSVIYFVFKCDNAIEVEKKLIEYFNEHFECYQGREYFKGDVNKMKKEFKSIYEKYSIDDENIEDSETEDSETEDNEYEDDENILNEVDLENILNADDLDECDYNQALQRYEIDKTLIIEKYKIEKYKWKKTLGINKLDKEILKKFTKKSISNFTSLIDERNIQNYDDQENKQTKKDIEKCKILNILLNDLGFEHIFDSKIIFKENFEKAMNKILNGNPVFTNFKNTRILFSLDKKKKKYDFNSIKSFLGFLNTLFCKYHISISYKQIRKEGKKIASYYLKILDGINELLEYKMIKGFSLHDPSKIRSKPEEKDFIYKSLFY